MGFLVSSRHEQKLYIPHCLNGSEWQKRFYKPLLKTEQNDGIGKQLSVKSTEPIQLKTFFYCLRFEIVLISLSKMIYE